MRYSATTVAVSISYIIFSNVVFADWQYTKWGMTVEEVIIASNGSAIKSADTGRDVIGAKSLAIAQYFAGEFVFEANFLFDRKTQKLRYVMLSLEKGNPNLLYEALVNRYGKPVETRASDDTNIKSARWLDRENNNNVNWVMIAMTDEVHTNVRYSALIGESENAL